jgi:uncharacterized membrane protein YfcA
MLQLAAVGAILLVSTTIQATVGFAAGLFGIPLLMLVGRSLPEAVLINLIASLVQSGWGAYELRRKIAWRRTVKPVAIRLLAMPAGIYTMGLVDSSNRIQATRMIGLVLLAIVVSQWLWRIEPRERLHPAWGCLAFSASGFMAGFCGMGGPALVLWLVSHRWSAAKSRAFMFSVFAAGMLPQGAMLLWSFGSQLYDALVLGIVGIVPVLVGTAIGMRLGRGLPKTRLVRMAYGLLVLLAVSAIVR